MIKRHKMTPIMHRAVEHNGVVYCGGMIADHLNGSMGEQTIEVCNKLDALLVEPGSSREKLLSATMYIRDMSEKEEMNAAWKAWIAGGGQPSRATIGVSDFGQGSGGNCGYRGYLMKRYQ